MEIMFSLSKLSRAEPEMMAVVLPVANSCKYCKAHHETALRLYEKDEPNIQAIINPDDFDVLNERETTLCRFASHLTMNTQEHENSDYISGFHQTGFSDSTILDTVLVISCFNFVNRIVLAPGVEPEEKVKG